MHLCIPLPSKFQTGCLIGMIPLKCLRNTIQQAPEIVEGCGTDKSVPYAHVGLILSNVLPAVIRGFGTGIPEEKQAKVFWQFYRGREHASEEGVGIGLYLVRQIAEGQGGYVKVSSQPGKGSTFSLYLPRK